MNWYQCTTQSAVVVLRVVMPTPTLAINRPILVFRVAWFGCCRLSYGPIQLTGESVSTNIDVTFSATYQSSTVEVLLNKFGHAKRSLGTSTGNGIAAVPIPAGAQSAVELIVTAESGISSTYDLTVILPLPSCTDAELSDWCLHDLLPGLLDPCISPLSPLCRRSDSPP